MENFNQIESDILNKIKSVIDRNSYEKIKTEIFGKKGIITELFKKIGSLDQGQKKEYASKLNDLKTKVTEILEKKLVDFDQSEINKEENINADVFGPLAFDNSISKKSAAIKGIKNAVAGQADVLLVPGVETGNGLVKMMIYFMGACAAGVVIGGKVPVVITSRSDEVQARLASIAAAVVALD